jgi:hypothetical protein
LEPTTKIPYTRHPKLKSKEKVPVVIPIINPKVLLFNGFDSEIIEYVPFQRLKVTGFNKWKRQFIYAALGPEGFLYLSYTNPQANFLEKVQLKAVFEDFIEVFNIQYGTGNYDIME